MLDVDFDLSWDQTLWAVRAIGKPFVIKRFKEVLVDERRADSETLVFWSSSVCVAAC
jgi:hypothetical protein